MALDYSKLSTEDLMALKSGDLSKVSTEGLKAIRPVEAPPVEITLKPTEVKPKMAWSDVPAEAVSNLPSSAGKLVSGIAGAVMHPIDTVSTIADLGAGALQNILPKQVVDFVNQIDANNPQAIEAAKHAVATANAVGGIYKQKYGTEEGFKRALAEDPVGVAGDISMLLSGGAGVVSKVGKVAELANAPKIANIAEVGANALRTGATYTNPINALPGIVNITPQPIKNVVSDLRAKAGAGAGNLAASSIGAVMGKSPENLKQAYSQGKLNSKEIIQNLTGETSADDILTKIKQGISSLQTQKSNSYRTAKEGWAADKTPIDFTPIEDAFNKEVATLSEGGHKIVGKEEMPKIDEVKTVLDEWKADPEMHNALGLDSLKRRIDAIYPESPKHNQAQRIISATRNAVKNLITEQVPEYATAMTEYEKQNSLINDINKALGSSQNADKATAINKVMKVLNESPSAKFKQDLVAILKEKTGVDIMPAIAGQNLQEWLPQGIGKISGYGGLAYALSHGGATLPLFAAASPRLMANAFYKAGQLATSKNKLAQKLSITPENVLLASKLAQQNALVNQ